MGGGGWIDFASHGRQSDIHTCAFVLRIQTCMSCAFGLQRQPSYGFVNAAAIGNLFKKQ
jgi:hypothetical protein